jgi:hypothetical protein
MTATAAASGKASAPVTSTRTPSPLQEWLNQPRNRYLAAGLAAVLVALVVWFVMMSGRRKEQFAGRALDQARAAAER